MGWLDYVWDFIGDLCDNQGKIFCYKIFFLDYYFYCYCLLCDKNYDCNECICWCLGYEYYLEEYECFCVKKQLD